MTGVIQQEPNNQTTKQPATKALVSSLTRIFRYLRDYRGSLAGYVLCSLMGVVFSVVSIGMLAPVLNVLFRGESLSPLEPDAGFADRAVHSFNAFLLARTDKVETLAIICGVVVLFIVLKNLFLYSAVAILLPVRHSLIRRLRSDMFARVLELPMAYFTEARKGDLMSRMTTDVAEVQTSVMSVMEVFVREPLTITVILTAMIWISPQLSLFLLLFLPVSGAVIGKIGSSLRRRARQMAEQQADITTVLDETLAGMRVVKAFGAEDQQARRFDALNWENYRTRNGIARRQELASPLSETLGVTVVAIILWYGGRLVLRGEGGLAPELFITYIALFTQVINPVKNLSSAVAQVQKGTAALNRMEEVLQAPATVADAPDAAPVAGFRESIELRNVSFAYGDRLILDRVNLTIGRGQTVALVGASGAGKSTLADLVPRFHDPTGGAVLLDGRNLRSLKIADLRALIGVVNQEPILFNDTVAANIMLGTTGATQEAVETAARIARAHDFILAKPEGYNTVVGDRGTRLSGGERQRLTIARAVLKSPPILILDEATSSLDTESERLVQEAINGLMKDRTCLVIAHRLSTVRNADHIVVLDRGRVVEEGTHDALMTRGGIYQKLVEMQEVR